MDYPSPDHSTISRFRKRLSKDAMIKINSELLWQFHQLGLSINEGVAVDTKHGFILSENLSSASHNDSIYFPCAVVNSMHTEDKIQAAYGDKGYAGGPNRRFLALNNIKDGIMRKDNINAKLTEFEIERNKGISKFRYIVEQYFGISHKYDKGNKARFPKIMTNTIDIMFRQFAFNLKKGAKILEVIPV